MGAPDDDRDALWQAVPDAMIPWYRGRELLAFAELCPEDPRWREYVRAALQLDAPTDYMAYFLDIITLFPDYGAFAVPEILGLTRHPDPYI
jgi:hypothetical protein